MCPDYQRESADNFPHNESPFTREVLAQRDRLSNELKQLRAENAELRKRCEDQEKMIEMAIEALEV
jgi:cell shape-determining protein MreC